MAGFGPPFFLPSPLDFSEPHRLQSRLKMTLELFQIGRYRAKLHLSPGELAVGITVVRCGASWLFQVRLPLLCLEVFPW